MGPVIMAHYVKALATMFEILSSWSLHGGRRELTALRYSDLHKQTHTHVHMSMHLHRHNVKLKMILPLLFTFSIYFI